MNLSQNSRSKDKVGGTFAFNGIQDDIAASLIVPASQKNSYQRRYSYPGIGGRNSAGPAQYPDDSVCMKPDDVLRRIGTQPNLRTRLKIPEGKYTYILGAQKSGTSTLHRLLKRHRDIYFYPQEAALFDLDTFTGSKKDWVQFEHFFDDWRSESVIGLKRANLLHYPHTAKIIKSVTPDARFIVLLRDPIDRVISAYYHYLISGYFPPVDIREGLPRLLYGDWGEMYPKYRKEIISFGFYASQLEMWMNVFDPDRFKIITLEEMAEDMPGLLRSCCSFLEVDENADFGDIEVREKEAVYSLHRLRLLQMISFRNMGEHDLDQMDTEDRLFVKTIEEVDRMVMAPLFPKKKPELDAKMEQHLRDIYYEESKRLEKMLHRDLSQWRVFQ